MSIIFGIRAAEGERIQEQQLVQLGRATDRYAPDGTQVHAQGRIGMGFQPYYSHGRSKLESQPASTPCGNMLVLDGRLDNYKELQRMLGIHGDEIADSFIVLCAFERWGERCFARLVGDWALALWSARDHSLYLARDHAGTRTLYFEYGETYLFWSTYLETFFADSKTRKLDMEYAACYLAGRPLRNRTPYQTIRAVPPAHYLRIQGDRFVHTAHWNWMINDRLCYRSDSDYEYHFLELFGEAVTRRTGPGAPILAELSGGMDSSSIVCMSDTLRRSSNGRRSEEFLDTLSLFNDHEPAWDEKPYFSLVEQQRGKAGTHIDTEYSFTRFEPPTGSCGAPLLPGADSAALEREHYWEGRIGQEYSVILSGIGGDELLGGVPSPAPELADLLIDCHLGRFLRRATEWCLVDRSPLIAMLCKTVAFSCRMYSHQGIGREKLPEWISQRSRPMCAYSGLPQIEKRRRVGLSPSTIDNGLTWWFFLETLPHLFPSQLVRREYRYPYLDRNLVEFLFRVPRSKLVHPGRRRALMRNALRGIVPDEILERRRKAYIVRQPLIALQADRAKIEALLAKPLVVEYGLVIPSRLQTAVRSVCTGHEPQLWPSLLRCISFELWLQALAASPFQPAEFV